MDGADSISCGICLSESRKAIRGYIDSCDHYFCFVCIIEWAKVESRCPICKRRFTSIRRTPKAGIFTSERVVNVPKRDQAYHPFGNATIGPLDPYAEVKCTVCLSQADECLLLLCDLCDSAAHTYCVGLGTTVPEGDWLCHDCAVSRTEHDNIQRDDEHDHDNHSFSGKFDVMQTSESRFSSDNFVVMELAESSVSISDIVYEPNVPLHCKVGGRFSPSPVSDAGQSSTNIVAAYGDLIHQAGGTTLQGVANKEMQVGVRTLGRCKNVQGYISALRENWNGLQTGSLSFSSSPLQCSSKICQKRKSDDLSSECLGQLQSSSSTVGQQLTIQDAFPGRQDSSSQDIDRAWRMMAKAKPMLHAYSRRKSDLQVSEHPSNHGNGKILMNNSPSTLSISKNQQLGKRNFKNTSEKQFKNSSVGKRTEKQTQLNLEKQKQINTRPTEIIKSVHSLPFRTSRGFSTCISSWKVQSCSQVGVLHPNGARRVQKHSKGTSSNFSKEGNGSVSSRNLNVLMGGASDSLNTNVEPVSSSSLNSKLPGEIFNLTNGCTERYAIKYDEARSEIQSVVKLNLKLLTSKNKLGVDSFKEVARRATHIILAACGFRHSRYVSHSFPRSVCRHSEQLQQLHKSNLMSNSCQDCFYIFVKDVVSSILSEKLCDAKS